MTDISPYLHNKEIPLGELLGGFLNNKEIYTDLIVLIGFKRLSSKKILDFP